MVTISDRKKEGGWSANCMGNLKERGGGIECEEGNVFEKDIQSVPDEG